MFAFFLLCFGCREEKDLIEEPIEEVNTDVDGDGFDVLLDCDDSDATINPNAMEICDGLDNDCDEEVDEGVLNTYYLDADSDGFGDEDNTTLACTLPDGYVLIANDCDDSDPEKFPGSTKMCDEWDSTFCSGGGVVSGSNFRGAFCQSPLDVISAPPSQGESFVWQPGSFTTISR